MMLMRARLGASRQPCCRGNHTGNVSGTCILPLFCCWPPARTGCSFNTHLTEIDKVVLLCTMRLVPQDTGGTGTDPMQGDGTVSIHQHLEEVKFMNGENT
jgi:hypothetical protein